MQTKRIKCPKCGVVLDVKNSQNEVVKQITCPSCKTALQVKFQPQQEKQDPVEAHTYYAPPKQPMASDGETQLAGTNYGATQLYAPAQKPSAGLSFGGRAEHRRS